MSRAFLFYNVTKVKLYNMKKDIIIIGCGLFGSVTAKYLRDKGMNVLTIDNESPLAASKCSFGLWRDGWIEKIKSKASVGISVLKKYAKVEKKELFDPFKEKIVDFHYIDCDQLLEEPDMKATVHNVHNNTVYLTDNTKIKADIIIIAAGYYTNEILFKSDLETRKLDGLWGATMDVDLDIDSDRLWEWAPYKQAMILKKEGYFMFGDGSTVKNPAKMTDARIKSTSERLQQHLNTLCGANIDNQNIIRVREGMRPKLSNPDEDYIKKHTDSIYSVTGGGKNSTVLSGYVAQELYKLISE